MLNEIEELKLEYQRIKEKYTTNAADKSIAVNLGKIIEEVAPALPTFPYLSADCRSLLDPIDYMVFEGLAESNQLNNIHFPERALRLEYLRVDKEGLAKLE